MGFPVQVCLAYRGEGGRTIAVLSSRAKPDMEAVLKEALPIADRHGSTIVVRQGVWPALPWFVWSNTHSYLPYSCHFIGGWC